MTIDATTECSRTDCEQLSAYRYKWPGRPQQGVCERHVHPLKARAKAGGIALHVITLPLDVVALLADDGEHDPHVDENHVDDRHLDI